MAQKSEAAVPERATSALSQAFLTSLIARVAEALPAPTDAIPVTRCVARPTLSRLLVKIRDSLDPPRKQRASATELLEVLVDARIAEEVPLTDLLPGMRRDRLYALGLGIDANELDPCELLQAQLPRGVVCYFSALAMHELTTQHPSHHHIATLSVSSKPKTADATTAALRARAVAGDVVTDRDGSFGSLGTRLFAYHGIRYYATSRERHRVRGIQSRYLSDTSRIRVTTLEQTLLDTLHRPISCGGAAVVFEAWDRGMRRADPARILKLLRDIGDTKLERRAGFMLARIDESLSAQLGAQIRASPDGNDDAIIPLLPGIPSSTVDARWGVSVP